MYKQKQKIIYVCHSVEIKKWFHSKKISWKWAFSFLFWSIRTVISSWPALKNKQRTCLLPVYYHIIACLRLIRTLVDHRLLLQVKVSEQLTKADFETWCQSHPSDGRCPLEAWRLRKIKRRIWKNETLLSNSRKTLIEMKTGCS